MADRGQSTQVAPSYESPRVERVLTPADLEDEVLYAGVPSGQDTEVPAP